MTLASDSINEMKWSIKELSAAFGAYCVSLAPIAYFIGWNENHAFNIQLGLGWMEGLQSPSVLIKAAILPLLFLMLGVCGGLALKLHLTSSGRDKWNVLLAFGLAAVVNVFQTLFFQYALYHTTSGMTSIFPGLLPLCVVEFSISIAGFAVVNIVSSYRRTLSGLYLVWIFIQINFIGAVIGFVPKFIGVEIANICQEKAHCGMRVAKVDGEDWYVLTAVSQGFVLLRFENDEPPVARIVTFEKVDAIRTAAKPLL